MVQHAITSVITFPVVLVAGHIYAFDSQKRALAGANVNFLLGTIEHLERDYDEHTTEWNILRKIVASTDHKLAVDRLYLPEQMKPESAAWNTGDMAACWEEAKNGVQIYPTVTDFLATRIKLKCPTSVVISYSSTGAALEYKWSWEPLK